MERKEMLKRLGSYALTISLITGSSSLLSGCENNNETSNNETKGHYYVVFNDNNAIVYDETFFMIKYDFKDRIIIFDGDKSITITDYISFDNYTKDEVEEKVKDLIGEDGNITYYGLEEEKKLKKLNN